MMGMREISFRGKRISNGEWEVGENYARVKNLFEDEDLTLINNLKVDPETVGQYTGMKDKHGDCIFDGDIIKSIRGYTAVVEWTDDGRFLGRTVNRSIVYVGQEPAVEIIGNIFDNPEMLTAQYDHYREGMMEWKNVVSMKYCGRINVTIVLLKINNCGSASGNYMKSGTRRISNRVRWSLGTNSHQRPKQLYVKSAETLPIPKCRSRMATPSSVVETNA